MNHLTELHRTDQLYTIPGFVKEASLDDAELADLPAIAFADPETREYPIHTKAAAWLSNARFWDRAAADTVGDTAVATSLLRAADTWDIRDSVSPLIDAALEHRKQAEQEVAARLTFAVDHDDLQMYPIADAASLQTSAAAFYRHRASFHYPVRKQAAERLLDGATRYNSPIPAPILDYLEKAAGKATVQVESLMRAFVARGSMLKGAEADDVRQAMAAGLSEIGDDRIDGDAAVKAAEMLDALDRAACLWPFYHCNGEQTLGLPEELERAEKRAESIRLSTGASYGLEQIKRAGRGPFDLIGLFDDCATNGALDPTKVAAVLPTLPRPDALLFEQALSAAAV
jgi:hypothetical protein